MRLSILPTHVLLLGTLSIARFAWGELSQVRDLGALPEVEFSKLSQRDPNPLAEKALAIHPDQWKHAETEHFIYHFVHNYIATRVSVEAEFHYRLVAKELERDQPAGDTKSHIYIFEQPEEWTHFQVYGSLESWSGGIHSAGSLFIQRNPGQKFSNNALGHEIVHLVLHRFYSDSIPSWLDEGFAQYVSKAAHASYQRSRGYLAAPHSQAVGTQDFIPLATLLSMTHPPSESVTTFYDESEKLVRFLAGTDKPRFLTLLDSLARHQPFETVFPRIYAGKFASTVAMEEKFHEYAIQNFEPALQQVDDK